MEGIQNKPLTTNFDRYKDKYGNILKDKIKKLEIVFNSTFAVEKVE